MNGKGRRYQTVLNFVNKRNRLHGIRSQLRPKFISSGSAGSRRVQRLPRMAPNASSAHREVLENADTFETRVTYSPSGYPRVHDDFEVNLSLGSRHPLSRVTYLETAPTYQREFSSSFSMSRAETSTSLPSRGTMGEVSDEANIRTVLSSNKDVSIPAYHTLPGEGSFREATWSDVVSHDGHTLASSSAAFTRFMDPLFKYEGEDGINYRFDLTRDGQNLSQGHPYQSCSTRGPLKRKSSALDSPFTGDLSVSSQSLNVPIRYTPAVRRSSPSSRQPTLTSSASSIFAFTSSSMGQNVASLNALSEGLTGLEDQQFSQTKAFLREFPDRHFEPLRTNRTFATSMSDQAGRQYNQDTGSTDFRGVEQETTSTNLYPTYRQATQIGFPSAQVHPWSSCRRIQEGAFSNHNLMNAWCSDSLTSVDQFSGARGRLNDLGFNGRRENRSMQVIACHLDSRFSQNGFDQNRALSRSEEMASSNQDLYEWSIADGSNQNFSINANSSETRNRMSYNCHPITPVIPSSGSFLSDHQVRSHSAFPPRVPHRLTNFPTWSTNALPSEAPASSSMVRNTFIGHSLSTALFQAQPLEPSVEHHNEGFQSADTRISPRLSLSRSRTYDGHRPRDISNGVAEQLLMLDATVLFGPHDQHSDWRLDVDNMSYEELLALEERIGNVSTGLAEDVLSEKLKRRMFSQGEAATSPSQETEVKCSVCQEEYEEGDDLGMLNCGHSYHANCIKQWLVRKNQCPVCKVSAFSS